MQAKGSWVITLRAPLSTLTPDQVSQIDRYLTEMTAFGQVTLVKRDGRVRFIERTESFDSVPSVRGQEQGAGSSF